MGKSIGALIVEFSKNYQPLFSPSPFPLFLSVNSSLLIFKYFKEVSDQNSPNLLSVDCVFPLDEHFKCEFGK